MTATRITMTRHIKEERLDRLTYIAMNVGFGNVVLEQPRVEEGKRDCLTDTGVLLVKDIMEEVLVTAYIISIDKATAMYKHSGYQAVPTQMRKIIIKNEKHLKKQNIARYQKIGVDKLNPLCYNKGTKEREVNTMNEFEIIKKALERVGAEFTCHDFARVKDIYITAGDGELNLEFDENGNMIDSIYWRD